MGAEAREPSVRGLAGILAVLVGIMLILNQEFWGTMDVFLRKPLIPVSQTSKTACAKVQHHVFDGDCEAVRSEADLILAAAAISEKPDLLLKDAVPHPAREDRVLAELPMEEEALAASLMQDNVQPETKGAAHLPAEAAVAPVPMASQMESSDIIPESLPDTPVIVGEIISRLPAAAEAVPEEPSDKWIPVDTVEADRKEPVLMENVEDTEKRPLTDNIEDVKKADPAAPKEPEIVPGKPAGEPVTPEPVMPQPVTPEPIMPQPVTPEPIMPQPVTPELVVPQPVTPEPVVPQPVTPDEGIPDSGAEEIPPEIVEGEGAEAVQPSGFLLDEAGMMCAFRPEYAEIVDGCLELPAECTGIRSGAFLGCGAGIVEMYIPAGVAVIEEGALSGLDNLEWIEVEGGNAGYASVSGVLFDSSTSMLVKFPSGRVDVYSIPSQTAAIAGGAFEGTSLNRLDLRRSAFVSFVGNVFGDSAGNGIEIAVPEEQYEMYAQMLSGYSVMLTK